MLMQDVRYAIRSLLKNPGFTAIAVACLAIGIGVNSTIFSVVDGVILRPYPYPDAHQIIVIHAANAKEDVTRRGLSYADFQDYRASNFTVAWLAVSTQRSLFRAVCDGEPERDVGATVSWYLFRLLGMAPIEGRNFPPDDARPGADPVRRLSDDVWERRYQ